MGSGNFGEIERVVAVDWSGDRTLAGQRKKIWAGVWTGGVVTLEAGRTRAELAEWLVELARETPAMVVGVDFCFSYPAWFLSQLGAKTAAEFWQMVDAEGRGEAWLGRDCGDGRFWGRKGSLRNGKLPAEFLGDARDRMFRRADVNCKFRNEILDPKQAEKVKGIAPKSPFQIGGAGAVGTGSLRGIPTLCALQRGGFSVWPFDEPNLPIVLEIYPRLLTGAVNKSSATERQDYLSQLPEFGALAPDVLKKAEGSEDAFDALVSVLAMAEQRESFLSLKQASDAITLLEGAVWGAGEV